MWFRKTAANVDVCPTGGPAVCSFTVHTTFNSTPHTSPPPANFSCCSATFSPVGLHTKPLYAEQFLIEARLERIVLCRAERKNIPRPYDAESWPPSLHENAFQEQQKSTSLFQQTSWCMCAKPHSLSFLVFLQSESLFDWKEKTDNITLFKLLGFEWDEVNKVFIFCCKTIRGNFWEQLNQSLGAFFVACGHVLWVFLPFPLQCDIKTFTFSKENLFFVIRAELKKDREHNSRQTAKAEKTCKFGPVLKEEKSNGPFAC